MKKTLYLECNSGISGDMTVGALLDLGADRKVLEDALASLGVDGYHLHFGTTEKCGIKAYDFDVHLEYEEHEHHHDHEDHDHDEHEHHHDHGEGCTCGCHDHDHEHHHHDHDEDGDHEHEHHHHDHDDECCCGHDHDHEHHHHHHADEVFTSWGMETIVPVTKDQLEDILKRLAETKEFGDVLRAKGMLPTENPGEWLYFDLVPEQYEIRDGKPDYTGKVCVIGASLKEEELNKVFGRG